MHLQSVTVSESNKWNENKICMWMLLFFVIQTSLCYFPGRHWFLLTRNAQCLRTYESSHFFYSHLDWIVMLINDRNRNVLSFTCVYWTHLIVGSPVWILKFPLVKIHSNQIACHCNLRILYFLSKCNFGSVVDTSAHLQTWHWSRMKNRKNMIQLQI